jgi:hypothetical protein
MNSENNLLKSFTVQDTLNPVIWDLSDKENPKLKSEIREKLLEIAYQFVDYIDIDVFIDDVVMTGSLANYNWSDYSDIDLHLIIDYSQFSDEVLELYQKLFNLKKMLFNEKHDIKIKNYEVELYAQDEKESHTSSGVYSVLYNEWKTKPKKTSVTIDKNLLKNKAESWMNKIDEVLDNVKPDDLEDSKKMIDKLKTKLKDYRKSGLEKKGEFSYENLVFKYLRRNKYIEKLYNFEDHLIDKELSLQEI